MTKSEKPQSAFNETEGFPVFPCLVVIRITPLAAREPYKEAAAASFITVIFSISDVLIVDIISIPASDPVLLIFPEFTGTPSITYRGELDALKDPIPRILMEEEAPG